MKTIGLYCLPTDIVDVTYVVGSVGECSREFGVDILRSDVTSNDFLKRIEIRLSVEGLEGSIRSFERDLRTELCAELLCPSKQATPSDAALVS